MYFHFSGEARTPRARQRRRFSGYCFADDRSDAERSVCNEIDPKGWEISELSFTEEESRPVLLPRDEIMRLDVHR